MYIDCLRPVLVLLLLLHKSRHAFHGAGYLMRYVVCFCTSIKDTHTSTSYMPIIIIHIEKSAAELNFSFVASCRHWPSADDSFPVDRMELRRRERDEADWTTDPRR